MEGNVDVLPVLALVGDLVDEVVVCDDDDLSSQEAEFVDGPVLFCEEEESVQGYFVVDLVCVPEEGDRRWLWDWAEAVVRVFGSHSKEW